MSVELRYKSELVVKETFADTDLADPDVTHSGISSNKVVTAGSSVPVTKCAHPTITLTSGAASIDLRNLLGTAGATVDGNGLKVQAIKLKAPNTNGNTITASKGASNGYGLTAGNTTWSVPLAPGQEVTLWGDEKNPDIDGTHKIIDLAGTGSTDKIECGIVMG